MDEQKTPSVPVSQPTARAKKEKAPNKTLRSSVKCPKGTRDFHPSQMRIRDRAFSLVKGIFQRHGAVALDTPVFELKETLMGQYGEDSKLIYDLADQGGEICALRYDLTVPFARYLGEHGRVNMKRYHIARVYRRDQPALTKGRFREFYQCDFDIAGEYAPMVPDSECIKVACEVLEALPIGGFSIKLNHRQLIDAIMEVSGVPSDKFRTICSAIDKLDKEDWKDVKKEMIKKGLDEPTADHIGRYVTRFKGAPFAILEQLKADPALVANPKAASAFADLLLLFNYVSAMGCVQHVSFDLSLARGLDYYTGVIYEAVLTSGTSSLGSIAAGGRYDRMAGKFTQGEKQIPCVGISVGIERIFALLEEEEKKKAGGKAPRENHTQVLVASVGPDLLVQRIALCNSLWAVGINAEFVYDVEPSPKKQMDVAVKGEVPIVVWMGKDEEAEGVVKVKHMQSRVETKVSKTEVVQALVDMVKALPSDT